jgi:hypothetical protein
MAICRCGSPLLAGRLPQIQERLFRGADGAPLNNCGEPQRDLANGDDAERGPSSSPVPAHFGAPS